MANAALMGPPSPREPRRTRRAPLHGASNSRSPVSPPPDSHHKPHRPPLPSNTSSTSSRSKRANKHEDQDDSTRDRTPSAPTAPTPSTTSRNKRKKDRPAPISVITDPVNIQPDSNQPPLPADDDDESVTRCVCGNAGELEDAENSWMIQCETCEVWQHGVCFGFKLSEELDGADWYCEQCNPEVHQELLKRAASYKTQTRHPSAGPRRTSLPATSTTAPSQSPPRMTKPTKRRNTMNSRFEEEIKELIEATAAEAQAAAAADTGTEHSPALDTLKEPDPEEEYVPGARRKRKRSDDDARSVRSAKRTRSASATSELPMAKRDPTPVTTPTPVAAPPKTAASRNKRGGGGRKTVLQEALGVENEEGAGPSTARRHAGGTRGKAHARDEPRRNQLGNGAEGAAAARNLSHYAAATQPQQLLTSWSLPDYLAHLEHILPADAPANLDVGDGTERGVKVRWPGKRMGVGDMNKRVRALVEWIGREQTNKQERDRRGEALQEAMTRAVNGDGGAPGLRASPMEGDAVQWAPEKQTMKLMEELMEELITFQEKFGGGTSRYR